jgi:hypothetical protein
MLVISKWCQEILKYNFIVSIDILLLFNWLRNQGRKTGIR